MKLFISNGVLREESDVVIVKTEYQRGTIYLVTLSAFDTATICFSIFCIVISLDVSVSLLIGRIKFRQSLFFKADWFLRCLSKDCYKHFLDTVLFVMK